MLTLKFSALRSKGVKRSFRARITLVMTLDAELDGHWQKVVTELVDLVRKASFT